MELKSTRVKYLLSKVSLILLFGSMLFSFVPLAIVQAGTGLYKDVNPGDWYFGDVKWATENQMVSGYDDGTFVPDAKVTEAEFLKMLIALYKGDITQKADPHWYDAYYRFAVAHKWNVYGILSYDSRNYPLSNTIKAVADMPLTRLKSAMILLNATGQEADAPDELIWALYNSNLSNGKTSKSVYGFQPHDLLTRAEAVSFIRNFKEINARQDLLSVSQIIEANRDLSITRIINTLSEMTEEFGYTFEPQSKLLNRYVKEEGNIEKGIKISINEDPSKDIYLHVSAQPHQRTVIHIDNLNDKSAPIMRELLNRVLDDSYKSSILEAYDMMPKATPRSMDINIPYNFSRVYFSTTSFQLSLDESDKKPNGYEGN